MRAKKSADDDVSGGKSDRRLGGWEGEEGLGKREERPTSDDNFPQIRMSAFIARTHSA